MRTFFQGLETRPVPASKGWKIALAAAGFALAAGAAPAWPEKVPIPADGPVADAPQPGPGETPDLWFPVGEQLTFELSWGVLPVGQVRVWTEWVREDDRWLLAIRMRTQSNKALSAIYPVDDYIESLVEPNAFLPVRFSKKINEGKSRYDETTVFNHARGMATWHSHRRNRTKEFPIEADTRDIPSLMWWFRKNAMEPGDETEFVVMADEKLYTVLPRPMARETVSTPRWGRVACIRFEPQAQFDGLFVRKGRLWVWVAEDDRRLAVRLVAQVPVASVKVTLTGVGGPGEDRWVGRGTPVDLHQPVRR